MNIESLNKSALKRVNDYYSLNIHGTAVITPYFMNNVEGHFVSAMRRAGVSDHALNEVRRIYRDKEIPYGWHRGKGTPEEIVESTISISQQVGLHLQGASSEAILEFMKLYALGIDCSGFVYNILFYAFDQESMSEKFENSLDWEDSEKKGVNRAGSFVFAGGASTIVESLDFRPLDLILIKSARSDKYVHIALALEEDSELVMVQSVLSKPPAGVMKHKMFVESNSIVFEFKPEIGDNLGSWEDLYKKGLLEFRRLNILSS